MTNERRKLKNQIERAVVRNFFSMLNKRCRSTYEVIAEPEPPDAIIRSKSKTSWFEVVCAYWTQQYAYYLHSAAKPVEAFTELKPGPYGHMDDYCARAS